MKVVAFDAGAINERGTSVAVFDYADHLERFGFGKAVMLHDPIHNSISSSALERFRSRFDMIEKPEEHKLPDLLARLNIDVLYRLKSGADDGRYVAGVRNVNHVVFRFDQPHGDQYAYISEWLSKHMTGGIRPWVPHIVSMPEPMRSLRSVWGIPNSATVLGRHGGFDQFNLFFAPRAISRALEKRTDLWFVFVNTKRFIDHERVLFLPAILDMQEKADFIGSCDGMIHARKIGESFGLAMAEFLALDKPVICWKGGLDRHHINMQPDAELLYGSEGDLVRILCSFGAREPNGYRKRAVEQFAPQPVMERFKSVFLDDGIGALPTTSPSQRVIRWAETRKTRMMADWWRALSRIRM